MSSNNNSELKALAAEVEQLRARYNAHTAKLERATEAHSAANRARKQLLDFDLSDDDARLTAAIKQTAEARQAVETAREQLETTTYRLDQAEIKLAAADDLRRRDAICAAIDARLDQLERGRRALDEAARAFCDLLSEGSNMGRGVATQVINGIAMATPAFTDLLSATRSYRERIRCGLEPLPAQQPAPAQRKANGPLHAART